MTARWRREFGPHGVTVNKPFRRARSTARHVRSQRDRSPRPVEELIGSIPVRRTGEPSDIANGCAYLCSDGAS